MQDRPAAKTKMKNLITALPPHLITAKRVTNRNDQVNYIGIFSYVVWTWSLAYFCEILNTFAGYLTTTSPKLTFASDKAHGKPVFFQPLAYDLRVFESLGTATCVQRKHDALLTMQWLRILRHTPGEAVKATLLVNIRAEMVYPHLHRNNNNGSITAC